MTNGETRVMGNSSPVKLRLVFILLALCAGAYYLGREQIDWRQFLNGPQEPAAVSIAKPGPVLPEPGFDAVSVDNSGMLLAAGRGPAGAAIVLKNGTEIIGETRADENGEWILTPAKPLAAGTYLFSLEAADARTGRTLAGKNTLTFTVAPPVRAAPLIKTAVATPLDENQSAPRKEGKTIAVRRGDTLWGLAHRHFGNPSRYPEIVDANKGQIKNPNLIFPKQEFEIPQK